jgi:hypothetical protein
MQAGELSENSLDSEIFVSISEKYSHSTAGISSECFMFSEIFFFRLIEFFSILLMTCNACCLQEALEQVAAIRVQLNALKEQEQQLRRGLGIFKIDQPPSKEIAALEKVSGHFF